MTFYDRTKEDSRPWREYQDDTAQDADDAAVATAAATEATTAAGGINTGISIAPNPFIASNSPGETEVQFSVVEMVNIPNLGTVTWEVHEKDGSISDEDLPNYVSISNSGLLTLEEYIGVTYLELVVIAKVSSEVKGIVTNYSASAEGHVSWE